MDRVHQGISELCPWCRRQSLQVTVEGARNLIPGVDSAVPLYDGSTSRYVNLDNAATTPCWTV